MITGSSHVAPLNEHWQRLVELALERGQTPLLNLGAGVGLLENIPTLVALHVFAQARRDIAAPTVVVGGAPVLWLVALLHDAEPGPRRGPLPSPPLRVVYSGPDLATQSATVDLLVNPGADPGANPQLSSGLAHLLAPETQSGAPQWETLPLLLTALAAGRVQPTGATEGRDPWLGWFGGGLALLLVILALLF